MFTHLVERYGYNNILKLYTNIQLYIWKQNNKAIFVFITSHIHTNDFKYIKYIKKKHLAVKSKTWDGWIYLPAISPSHPHLSGSA